MFSQAFVCPSPGGWATPKVNHHPPPPGPGHNTSLPPGPGHNTSLPPPWTRSQHLSPPLDQVTTPPPPDQVTTPPSPPPRTRSQHLPPPPPRTRSQHLPLPRDYAQAGGTPPNGMHSCLHWFCCVGSILLMKTKRHPSRMHNTSCTDRTSFNCRHQMLLRGGSSNEQVKQVFIVITTRCHFQGGVWKGWGLGQYSEVHCITGYSNMGTTPMDRWTNRHVWNQYLPATLLVR